MAEKIIDPGSEPPKVIGAKRIQGWNVDQWYSYVLRNPSSTLPGGVGLMLVEYCLRQTDVAKDIYERGYQKL